MLGDAYKNAVIELNASDDRFLVLSNGDIEESML